MRAALAWEVVEESRALGAGEDRFDGQIQGVALVFAFAVGGHSGLPVIAISARARSAASWSVSQFSKAIRTAVIVSLHECAIPSVATVASVVVVSSIASVTATAIMTDPSSSASFTTHIKLP